MSDNEIKTPYEKGLERLEKSPLRVFQEDKKSNEVAEDPFKITKE